MRLSNHVLPFALCALATIVGVAAILVLGDLLRRGVLYLIAALERAAPAAEAAPIDPRGRAELPPRAPAPHAPPDALRRA